MSNTVPAQHPAVVLRSSYQHLRALLAIAAIAIVGLTVAVAVLAIGPGAGKTLSPAVRIGSPAAHASTAPAVTANPDDLGPQPAAAQPTAPEPAPIVGYPGHF